MHAFLIGINLKVNAIVWLVVWTCLLQWSVQHFGHNAMGTLPSSDLFVLDIGCFQKKLIKKKSTENLTLTMSNFEVYYFNLQLLEVGTPSHPTYIKILVSFSSSIHTSSTVATSIVICCFTSSREAGKDCTLPKTFIISFKGFSTKLSIMSIKMFNGFIFG